MKAAVVILILAVLPLFAQPATGIERFQLPLDDVFAYTLRVGPDGSIWTSGDALQGDHLFRLRPEGTFDVLGRSDVGIAMPLEQREMAMGPDGAVWLYGNVRVDPADYSVTRHGSNNCCEVAGASDGSLWRLRHASGAVFVSRSSARGEASVEWQTAPALAIGSTSDGALWLSRGGNLVRVSPAGTFTDYELPADLRTGQARIASGAGIWLVKERDVAFVLGGQVTGRYRLPSAAPLMEELTGDDDGNLWFVRETQVWRISSRGVLTRFALPPIEADVCGRGFYAPKPIDIAPDGKVVILENTDRCWSGPCTPEPPCTTNTLSAYITRADPRRLPILAVQSLGNPSRRRAVSN